MNPKNHLTRHRITLALVSLVLVLGALEILGRLVVAPPVDRTDGFLADSVLGWVLPPGADMQWRGQLAKVNDLGFRGPPRQTTAPLSILMIGDSSMFGDGVADHQTMPAQLAARLGPQVDVQNGGVPGYTCWQSRILVKRVRERFNPDILITYNQHSDYRRASAHDRVIAATQLGPLANTGIGQLISALSLKRRMATNAANLSRDEYRDCLTALADDQAKHGGKMVFVMPISDVDFPSSPLFGQEEPGPPGTRLADYRDAMRETAARTGATLVDGAAAITAAGLSGNAALQDVVHPTPAGHVALAEAIAQGLKRSGILGKIDP
jgi:lysophospholipase L1-like esterase